MAGFKGWAMLFYTPTIYPGQGTDGEGRPSLGSALTYAHSVLYGHAPGGRSEVALTANLHVLTCDKACPERPCGCRASFMIMCARPDHWQ